MEYFVYGRDLPGAFDLKVRLREEHWSFMDEYADRLIARGPTMTPDESASTGSLHIVDLPDIAAARAFAYEEPYYLAGAFETVLLHRFRNLAGRTMWEFTEAVEDYERFLVFSLDPTAPEPAASKHLIVYGDLLALDGETRIGHAVLLEAPSAESAATVFPATANAEVHPWRFGGRN
ncbi:YciI family protein [Kribbella deserti]|uniref:YciI family protein n=1 Tax=Kribbella deserti TaxID=1926257 RepID=A0ABV6QD70_9ACTN